MSDTVQRIALGRVISAPPHSGCGEAGYVLGLGKKPRNGHGHLRAVDSDSSIDPVYKQISNASVALTRNALPLEEGPYKDKDGAVEELAEKITKEADGTLELIECIIDLCRPVVDAEIELQFPRAYSLSGYDFVYNQYYLGSAPLVLPDEPPAAGEILEHESRFIQDNVTGGTSRVITHLMEPIILAVSLLRRNNINAFPALAVMPGGYNSESYSPLVTIVDLANEVPITTFALIRKHPPMGSIMILSDNAMQGVAFAMLAEKRTKDLTTEMSVQNMNGRSLSDAEIENQLDRITDALFECHKLWPSSHFIDDSLDFLRQNDEALFAITLDGRGESLGPDQAISMRQYSHMNAAYTASNYTEVVLHNLKLKIAGSASS